MDMTPTEAKKLEAIGLALKKALATPHSAKCCRGSADTYEVVYGRVDPDCKRCAIDRRARRIVEADMF